jgi:retron-type reverse transcriptase
MRHPCSYGLRPKRRATTRGSPADQSLLEWVVEGDIMACFDRTSHPALMGRVRDRGGDKRVPAMVKAFLKAVSSARTVRCGTATPGLRGVGFSRLCSPMWPCRC